MGTRNHTSLSEDTIFIGWHANRFERWKHNVGKAGKKQTETNYDGTGRKIGKRIKSSQICRMLRIDTGMFYCIRMLSFGNCFDFICLSCKRESISICERICFLSLMFALWKFDKNSALGRMNSKICFRHFELLLIFFSYELQENFSLSIVCGFKRL